MNLPRVTPAGAIEINVRYFSGPVGANPWVVYQDEGGLGGGADVFWPEPWLSRDNGDMGTRFKMSL
ncbi:MAG: hypothetical protein Q9166_002687 [cf. Caloplaca sp. 2 TL-2023]